MIRTHPLFAALLVLGFAVFVFWRVRIDYESRGRLSPLSAALQVAVFFLHAAASYSFFDTNGSAGAGRETLQALAFGLMVVGVAGALAGMAQLSPWATVGRSVKGLKTGGVYRRSRNPQLVFYFLFLVGYVLLQPGWKGIVWLVLYIVIAHAMVLSEEHHLRRTFGKDYEEYCHKTPRYLGLRMSG